LSIDDIQDMFDTESSREEIVKKLQEQGAGVAEKIIRVTQKALTEIDTLLEESETAMRNLRLSSQTLDLQEFNVTRDFFARFNVAQVNLLDARKELMELASETVNLCEKIEIGIDNWQDEYEDILLKNQFKQLRRLLEVTRTKLDSAKTKYASLIKTWVQIDEDIDVFNLKLSNALRTSTEDFERSVEKLRVASYGTATAVTVSMVIADIFGCFGFCSGLVTTTTWATTAATIETQISEFKEEMKQMTDQLENAKARIKNLNNKSDLAVDILTDEMNLIINWEASAENLQNIMNDFTYEQIKRIVAFQKIFGASITKLKTAAQNFIDFAIGSKIE